MVLELLVERVASEGLTRVVGLASAAAAVPWTGGPAWAALLAAVPELRWAWGRLAALVALLLVPDVVQPAGPALEGLFGFPGQLGIKSGLPLVSDASLFRCGEV